MEGQRKHHLPQLVGVKGWRGPAYQLPVLNRFRIDSCSAVSISVNVSRYEGFPVVAWVSICPSRYTTHECHVRGLLCVSAIALAAWLRISRRSSSLLRLLLTMVCIRYIPLRLYHRVGRRRAATTHSGPTRGTELA